MPDVQLIRNIGVIENGEVVASDIHIQDGIIRFVEPVSDHNADADASAPPHAGNLDASTQIDGTGLLALPGVIDIHVHFRVPGGEYKEDWASGTRAAWEGGVTTVFDMPNNTPAITTLKTLREKDELIQQQAPHGVKYRLYIAATTSNLTEIVEADAQQMICGVKVYYGTSTGDLTMNDPEALRALMNTALTVPIVIHAEDDAVIAKNTAAVAECLENDSEVPPKTHSEIRSREAAITALTTIIQLVEETGATNVHITHITTAEEVQMIREAKQRGLQLTCDVTPHHLTFTTDDYATLGNRLRVNPPVRTQADTEALWLALADGTIDIVASDHAPHTKQEKAAPSYWDVPSGVPGVQHLLSVLMNGVYEERITWQKLIKLTATNPAKRFNLTDRGAIAPNLVADIVCVDPELATQTPEAEEYTKVQWSPYTDRIFYGAVMATLVDGDRVVDATEPPQTSQ
jgi:dihydroorotase